MAAPRANTEEVSTLFITPSLHGLPWVGANDGGFGTDALVEKCCAICSTGFYDGISYSFSEGQPRAPATCEAFTLRFIDDPYLGWYCTFSGSTQSKPFTTDSPEYYTHSLFYTFGPRASQNNLGGVGPDGGAQEIRFSDVGTWDGTTSGPKAPSFDLVVRAMTSYDGGSEATLRNGCKNGGLYGSVHLRVMHLAFSCPCSHALRVLTYCLAIPRHAGRHVS